MIENKALPSEFVSIRQIWLKRIDDCGRAIGQRAIQEANMDRQEMDIGNRTVIYTVEALYYSLVDYGEATIRSDVKRYYKNIHEEAVSNIWKSNEENNNKWSLHTSESIHLYDYIIQTLNKYGMLFESQPKGYCNVEMKSI